MRYLLVILFFSQCSYTHSKFNGGFESLDKTKNPIGWTIPNNQLKENAYSVAVDSAIKFSGKYSMCISQINVSKLGYGICDYMIPKTFQGKGIELRGFMKTQDIEKGYAGLWLRLDDEGKTLGFVNMQNEQIKGTNDWKQFTVNLPYNEDVKAIHFGGFITGKGKAWFDNFELFLDGKPIEKAELFKLKRAETDTLFNSGSGINKIIVNPQQLINLTVTGEFWGFLKYHHTEITSGNYNWDGELFKFLPEVMKAKNNVELSKTLEKYIDKLPSPKICKTCTNERNPNEILSANYGELFTKRVLSESLTKKLIYIRENRSVGENYWVSKEPAGNPNFRNEKAYVKMNYDDAGYRLLCLYRYWSMINYFYPYRGSIGEDWNKVLKDFVPQFVSSSTEKEYLFTTLKLIAKINDTHANIFNNPSLEKYKGKFFPAFQAKFIANKLVVTGYYSDTSGIKTKLKIGDHIVEINGEKIEDLIKKYAPVTPASNYETQLRNLPSNYLLRSNEKLLKLKLNRNGKIVNYDAPLFNDHNFIKDIDYSKTVDHYLVKENIGYIYAGLYKNANLSTIKKDFEGTKGIIIDLRCYPSDFMPFTIGNYIKSFQTPFAKITRFDLSRPGSFSYASTQINGGGILGDGYKGKVIVLVNSKTQSQAEYTAMAFQSSPNVKVIGSRTAGADGNISYIILPGGVSTAISGIGIYYPDNAPTQGVGVKLDFEVHPTVEGLKAGKDELLSRAIQMIDK